MLDIPPDADLQTLIDDRQDADRRLLCAVCGAMVTHVSARIQRAGSHRHEFANPAGERFRIGCFATAPGAHAHGRPSALWSWFDGYRWQVAGCRACGVQLGWHFGDTAGDSFYGLVLESLREQAG